MYRYVPMYHVETKLGYAEGVLFGNSKNTKNAPTWGQDGSKNAPKWKQNRANLRPSWGMQRGFCLVLELARKMHQIGAKMDPKIHQNDQNGSKIEPI